jgi:3-methylcrotonyl-CoA carboxylase alpha subunit
MADEPTGGSTGQIEVTPLGRGRYLVSDGSRQRLAWAAGPRHARWVFIDGHAWLIETGGDRDRPRSRAHEDDTALASPMPATVAAIQVRVGQDVSQGDLLVMLEAMKMEVAIRAPRDGRVRSIACAPGDLVQPGVPLVELD